MDFQKILSSISDGYTWFITEFSALFWVSNLVGWILFRVIVFYLIIFLVIIPIHKKLKKQRLIKEQEIVQDVDEMIYLLAKAQHTKWIDVRKLWGNPNIALMKSIFTKWNCDYIKSTYLILDNIHKVETLLWDKIISIDKESILLKDAKKYNSLKSTENVFFRIAVPSTLGIYYVLWA